MPLSFAFSNDMLSSSITAKSIVEFVGQVNHKNIFYPNSFFHPSGLVPVQTNSLSSAFTVFNASCINAPWFKSQSSHPNIVTL